MLLVFELGNLLLLLSDGILVLLVFLLLLLSELLSLSLGLFSNLLGNFRFKFSIKSLLFLLEVGVNGLLLLLVNLALSLLGDFVREGNFVLDGLLLSGLDLFFEISLLLLSNRLLTCGLLEGLLILIDNLLIGMSLLLNKLELLLGSFVFGLHIKNVLSFLDLNLVLSKLLLSLLDILLLFSDGIIELVDLDLSLGNLSSVGSNLLSSFGLLFCELALEIID